MKTNSILFFQAAKNSSSHRMSDILEYERNKKKKDSPQTDVKGKGAKLIGSARKRSLLPKGNSTLK
jgi:hypothetical protein